MFQVTTNGMLTTLAERGVDSDPGNLVLGADGNFYGTTSV